MNKKVNLIKNINLNKIRNALKMMGTATKPKLAEITGLSVVTVNSLMNTLIETGEVLPDHILNSEGGRPAASFRYNSNFRLALVIFMHEHCGQDRVFYGIVNLRGEVIDREEQSLSEVYVDTFDPQIEKLLSKYPQIQAICYGVPGAEINQKLIISDYEHMRNQSLSGHIKEKFHLPVLVENDINAALLGYCHRNNIPEHQCVVGLYFPDKYPPGAAIYLKGDIFKGRDGFAGEIKYLPFGIQWETFDYNSSELESFIFKTIITFSCICNPDRIILYGDKISQDNLEKLKEQCLTQIEMQMLPVIISSGDFNGDFEHGIKRLAMTLIENDMLS